jgi:hypothetical protein
VEQVPWARDLAHRLLAGPLPRRWAHTIGVAANAASVAHVVGREADLLVSAAWLHDIGYAPDLVDSGFHPLDGARFLRDVEKAPDPLSRLVAHHTCALVEAQNRGLADTLTHEFPVIDNLVSKTLTYCDITTSPDGSPITLKDRLNEIAGRYGSSDIVTRSIDEARPQLEDIARTIEALLPSLDTND